MSQEHGRKSLLERVLGLFAEIRSGEGGTALLLTLNIFLILTAYYIIKPVREALILGAPNGAEYKSYASAGQAILLLGAVPLYAYFANRVPRRSLINGVTLFFVSNLVLFYLLIKTIGIGGLPLGLGFFLWVGIFNLMVPAQFWSFANDVYTPDQGKRLFAIVAFGASIGAVMGSRITNALIEPLGIDQLLLVSGGILVLSLFLTNIVDSRSKEPKPETTDSKPTPVPEEEPFSKTNPFKLVTNNRYLLLIALLMLVLNWVNSTGEFILGGLVKSAAVEAANTAGIAEADQGAWIGKFIGGFYSDFFSVVNIVALVVQLFLVSRILKYIGVRAALLFLPFIALGGYAMIAFLPIGLGMIRWAKTAENATDYSLQNTVRQALFLPTTREQKYKAKQAIDTFFVRAGDVLSAVLVYVGLNMLSLSTQGFAAVNLALAAIWIALAIGIGREHRKLTEGSEAS